MLWPEGWWGQQVVGEGWIRVFEFNGDWQLFEVGWRCVWVDSAFKAVSQVKKCLSIEFLSLEWYLHCLYQWKNAFWQALKRVTKGKSKAGPWTCQTNPFIFLCKPECRRVTQLLASEPWRLATFFGFQHTWMKFKFQHILFLEILKNYCRSWRNRPSRPRRQNSIAVFFLVLVLWPCILQSGPKESEARFLRQVILDELER